MKAVKRLNRLWPPVLAVASLLGVWEAIVRTQHIAPLVLPAPSAIARELVSNLSAYLVQARITLIEAGLGFAAAFVVSMALAAVMVHRPVVDRAVSPLQTALRCTPIVAVAPALMLSMGFGLGPKVLMAALITFAPFLSNALSGLRSVDEATLEVFRSVNATKRQIFWKLRMPYASPYLFAAARICVSLALMGAVVAEWSGSSEGLGYTILSAQKTLDTTRVWACVALLTALGIAFTALVSLVERYVLRWNRT